MSKINVALRTRPLSSRETEAGFPIVVEIDENSAFITDIRVPEKPAADSRQRFRKFDFDHAFWLTECGEFGASQEEVYEEMGPPLEKAILDGYNACLLAYGQSGTGKTHTMLGTKTDPGLIPRLCQSLWEKLKDNRENSMLKMEVSFMEIYREKVRDLLTPDKPLKLREHPQNGPHVQDLTRMEVTEEMGLVDLLWEGERRRAIGTTGSNRRSSRSHAIWTLYLSYQTGPDFKNLITNQVHLVDLAGSERADLATSKNLLAEGADINRSLVSLGNVISSLAEKNQYIPYRDSALTWLLKDSLGGNAHTSIIITASPASCSHAQTLNSLRFAQRARLVENQPKVNLALTVTGGGGQKEESSSLASIFDIRKDISRLANILKVAQGNGGILRGLTPRKGWNRLITAIETWNHVQQKEEEIPAGKATSKSEAVTSTATTSTMTNASSKSSTDVMVQKGGKKKADLLSHHVESAPSSPSLETNNNLAEGKVGKDISRRFSTASTASTSGSIKCQTWSQSEVASLPKPETPVESEDEYTSPPVTPQIQRLQYKQLKIPMSHLLDQEARLGEKVYRAFQAREGKIQKAKLVMDEEGADYPHNVLTRDKIPALVNAQNFDLFDYKQASEDLGDSFDSEDFVHAKCNGDGDGISLPETGFTDPFFLNSSSNDFARGFHSVQNLNSHQVPKVQHVLSKTTNRKRTHRPPGRLREIVFPKHQEVFAMESTDESEFSDCVEVQLNQSGNKNYRTVDFGTQVEVDDVKFESDECSNDHEEYFSDSKSSDASSSASGKIKRKSRSIRSSKSSSSSYESLIIKKPAGHVKIVENSVYEFPADKFEDFSAPNFTQLEKTVTVASYGTVKIENAFTERVDDDVTASCSSSSASETKSACKTPVDCSNSTAYRNFHLREITHLDQIGKQIQSLQQLAQRYDVLKPYLKKIDELSTMDFSQPDPEIDAQIEHCSGWNVEIEFKKVQSEVVAINKILKSANNPSTAKPPRRDSSSASNQSHRTSSTSITSDSYSVTDPNSRRGSYESPGFENAGRTLSQTLSFSDNPVLNYMSGSFLTPEKSPPRPQFDPAQQPFYNYASQLQRPLQLHYDYTAPRGSYETPNRQNDLQNPYHQTPFTPCYPQTTPPQRFNFPPSEPPSPFFSASTPPISSMYNATSASFYMERQSQLQQSTVWKPPDFTRTPAYATTAPRQKPSKLILNLPPRPDHVTHPNLGVAPSQSYNSLQDSYLSSTSAEENVWSPPVHGQKVQFNATPPTKLFGPGHRTPYPHAHTSRTNPYTSPPTSQRSIYSPEFPSTDYGSDKGHDMNSPFRSLDGHVTNLSMSSSFCLSCSSDICSCEESFYRRQTDGNGMITTACNRAKQYPHQFPQNPPRSSVNSNYNPNQSDYNHFYFT